MITDDDEDLTAAPVRPLPPIPPGRIIATAIAAVLVLGLIAGGAFLIRAANDRLDHPNCPTWLKQRDALNKQVAADEQAGDQTTALIHAGQLQQWTEKKPTGCA